MTGPTSLESSQVAQIFSQFHLYDDGPTSVLDRSAGIGSSTSSFHNPLGEIAEKLNQTGAVLGLASVVCSFIPPLRPIGVLGINFLSAPPVAAALLASGAYSIYHQIPQTSAAFGRLFTSYSNSSHSRFEDLLQVCGFGVGALGIWVGASSFTLGGKTYLATRRQLLAEGFAPLEASRTAYLRADAVRRAVQDPEIWTQFARGNVALSTAQREFLLRSGHVSEAILLGGSTLVGVGKFGYGISHLYDRYRRGSRVNAGDVGNLLLGFALDVYPGVTTYLYRAGRGNRRFNLEPAMSQELTNESYRNPSLRTWVLEKLEKGLPRLSPQQERDYVSQSQSDLSRVEAMLDRAEALPILSQDLLALNERGFPGALPTSIVPAPRRFSSSSTAPGAPREPISRQELGNFSVEQFYQAYSEGRVTPTEVLKMILDHPVTQNGSIFPRPLQGGRLNALLRRSAEESTRRFQLGTPRPLEGIFVAVKDIFPGLDGVMQVGSKTSRITGIDPSPVVEILKEMGAIPVPVGMTAAANGGSGLHSGFGYIPHPTREGYDPAGSSSATAHVVGLTDFPINIGIGTDTGGSITAPAGAVGLFGFVPPSGVISTRNMVPFATFLDRVGVIARHAQDGMMLARTLSRTVGDDPHMRFQNPGMLYQPSTQKPVLLYLEKLITEASEQARYNFVRQLEYYRRHGYAVIGLDANWNFIAEAPMLLYPFDAYSAAAFTHTNPLRPTFMEPPRRTLDYNLLLRLPKGGIALRFGLFDRARQLSSRFQDILHQKIGGDFVLMSPSAEAITTQEILNGQAGAKLDHHDLITMQKNRVPDWGQLNLPTTPGSPVGVVLTGSLPNLLHFTTPPPQ